jgi:hypothetical protein
VLAAALVLGAMALAQSATNGQQAGTEKRITAGEAKQLFSLVDELTAFSSSETGLKSKGPVKRRLTSRAEVEQYLKRKFDEDEGAKRMERGEIVLKKFGLLDRDFDLKNFLLLLLKEQIEAYYDPKTKSIALLDWVAIEEQKPVLAHELTHALQDQHSDLEKWDNQTPDVVSVNAREDADHVARDEMDTARDAVTEGQATAVMMDYILKPMGKSLVKNPEVLELMQDQMSAGADSPVLARAPLLLSESLLFPYREGLSFEQDVWMDKGTEAAFAGLLDRPPSSTWEIYNPRAYEARKTASVPLMPNIHPLVDKEWKAYDIGQIGDLDLHILTGLFGGERAAKELTPAWDGGIYWAGQRRTARKAELASTESIAFFYLSQWRSEAAARDFVRIYVDELGRKYNQARRDTEAERTALEGLRAGEEQQVFATNEGPVAITLSGNRVFVAESFPLETARKLGRLVLDSQSTGELRMASTPSEDLPQGTLTGSLRSFLGQCGVMKAVARGAARAASRF